jgi:uncharacterized membrane protein
LSALVNYTTGSTTHASLTTFTHLAAGLAAYEVKSGKGVVAAIDDANLRVSTLTGLDILTTTPTLITDSINSSSSLTPELKYGMLAGAISMWTYKHTPSSAASPHLLPYTSIDFAQVLYQDISADGILDGFGLDSSGNSGQLSFGIVPLGVDVYRLGIGAAMVQMAADKNNKTGLTGASVLTFAKSYIASTDAIFNSVVPVPFAAPTVTVSAPAANSTVSNLLSVAASTQSLIGVSTVELLVDGASVATGTNLTAPTFKLDTTTFVDGAHVIGVRATDCGGLVTTTSVSVTLNNVAPTVTFTAPASNATVSGQLAVTATTQSIVGLNKVELLIDNVSISTSTTNLAAPTFSINTTTHLDGIHTISLRATTLGGLVTVSSIQVMFANVAPVVVITSPAPNIFVSGPLNVTAKTQSIVGLGSVSILVDGAVVGASANTTSPTFALDTVAYTDGLHAIGVRATDINGLVTTNSVSVTFNNVAPIVSISAPAANARVSGQATVQATTQFTNTLSTTELLVDNVSIATSTTNLTAPTFPLNTAAYLDGLHTIGVRATKVGGLVTVGSIPVLFVNNPPAVIVSAPAVNVWANALINVAATAQSVSGLSTVDLLVDGAAVATATNLAAPAFQLNTATYVDGQHTIGVRATDVNALVTTSSVAINVDNTAPTTTAIAGGFGTNVPNMTGCASDGGAGILSVTDVVNGAALTLNAQGCWFSSHTLFGAGAIVKFPIIVKDKASNCSNYLWDVSSLTLWILTSSGPC